MPELKYLLEKSINYRRELLEKLHNEGTDSYRLFHGISEGHQGLTIDRYGSLILAQTFREPLLTEETESLESILLEQMETYTHIEKYFFVYNHRGEGREKGVSFWYQADERAQQEKIFTELGLKYISKARHRGQDPLLFLDMRAGRRFVLNNSNGLSVLNLFAYTCGTGICAIAGAAKEVWNIDFAASSLAAGVKNAELNGFAGQKFKVVKTDVFAALRQFCGLPLKGRFSKSLPKPEITMPERTFDLVFLDPPAWSKGPFGNVDLVRDYQSIFKLALLATTPGGRIIAVNNVAKVNLEDWLDILRRCAVKAGRQIKNIEVIRPEADFPSWDYNYPLKIAVCEV
jgi:23S rRNA (cytosine1962-C5)-methyltransferase